MEPSTSHENEKKSGGENEGMFQAKRRRWRTTDASDADSGVADSPVDDANMPIISSESHIEAPTVADETEESSESNHPEIPCEKNLIERILSTEGTSGFGSENAVMGDDSSPNISEHGDNDEDNDDDEDTSPRSPRIIEVDEDGDHEEEIEEDEEERIEALSSGSEMVEDTDELPMPNFSTQPKHRYQVNQAVRARELGRATRLGADWFAYRYMGSLHAVERLELMTKLEGHSGCVNCISFNADGTKLASGSDDTNVVVWDWAADRPLISFDSGHSLNVFQAKFMPLSGDCHLVTCARDGQVRLAELSVRGVCKSTRRLARHSSSAHKLALDANSPHVFLSCGEDGVVFEIDLRIPSANKILSVKKEGRKVPLYSVNCNPADGNNFCVCGRDSQLRVYDRRYMTETGPALKSYCPHHLSDTPYETNITAAVYNHNGTELLATYNDDDIYTFDTSHSDGADFTHRYMGHRNNQTVKGVNYFGPKSEFIVSGSDCGNVFLWEHDSEKIVQVQFADEGGVVNVLETHPYAAVMATSGLDHDVKIWVPSNEKYGLDVAGVTKLVKKNNRLRARDRRHPEAEAEFIYFMLRRIVRNRAAERQRADPDDDGGGYEIAESDDSDETGSDMEDERVDPRINQCRPS